jgi:GntR family transcriptional repressor for pyruvate dehydrogenase complex
MDEESLFRDIHRHLLKQRQSGERIDTEMQLADRFHVSRYHVRQALAKLSLLGIIERTKKKGITVKSVEPENLSKRLESQLQVFDYDPFELSEARLLIDSNVLSLTARRIVPATLGSLGRILARMEGCIEFRAAFLKFHQQFWKEIYGACGNRVMGVYAASLMAQSVNFHLGHINDLPPDWYSDMLAADRAVWDSLKKGDSAPAVKALRNWLGKEYSE